MLPWFIWKEISKYAVPCNPELCLVNKEWFNCNAGQFLTARNLMFLGFEQYFDWLKLAETLDLSDARNFDWERLRDYRHVKKAKFLFIADFGDKYHEVVYFLQRSKIFALDLEFDTSDRNHPSYQVLKGINRYLKSLCIFLDDMEVINYHLLKFETTNITDFTIRGDCSSVFFKKIHESLPNLEYLTFEFNLLMNQQVLTDKLIFSNLKTLVIAYGVCEISDEAAFFKSFFLCYFPALIYFELRMYFFNNFLEKLPFNMPKLKKLHLELNLNEVLELFFPINPLLELEELYLHCLEPYEGEELELADDEFLDESYIELDLSKVPQLVQLNVSDNTILEIHSDSHYPLITNLTFGAKDHFSCKSICDKLLNLHEVRIGCRDLSKDFGDVIKLCERVDTVTLCDLYYPIEVDQLIPGPFKTVDLALVGNNFLTNELIHWLANQFQLTHLTLSVHDFETTLSPVLFPNLKKLDVKGFDEEKIIYLKTIFVIDSSNLS